MKALALLGSTGSIGTQTLELVRESAGGLEIRALAARRDWEKLAEQSAEFRPRFVAMADPAAAEALQTRLPGGTEIFSGADAAVEMLRACEYDICVHGMVGAAGLRPSVAVLEAGKVLALANKESLVVGGARLMELAAEHGGEIVPVDSEHSAIFQCLRGEELGTVRRVWLTASGGPFREHSQELLRGVTPDMALEHPNWDMGPRITVGSATMMNKALEVIEVHHLFGLERERIRVAVHPQSIVHSMVEFVDGSVIAQMGPPDMRGPIHYALHHPDRVTSSLTGFDFDAFRQLSFQEPDLERFPALELGFRCVEEGCDSGSVLNAADEEAVAAFLDTRIQFTDINQVNAAVLSRRPGLSESLDDLLEADRVARGLAQVEIAALSN